MAKQNPENRDEKNQKKPSPENPINPKEDFPDEHRHDKKKEK